MPFIGKWIEYSGVPIEYFLNLYCSCCFSGWRSHCKRYWWRRGGRGIGIYRTGIIHACVAYMCTTKICCTLLLTAQKTKEKQSKYVRELRSCTTGCSLFFVWRWNDGIKKKFRLHNCAIIYRVRQHGQNLRFFVSENKSGRRADFIKGLWNSWRVYSIYIMH